ncbi:MAG: zinc ribbon domain-containing protein, partial [Ktedonobacteraceae bacterium]
MQTTSCPTCGEALPESARYCAGCGKVARPGEATLHLQRPSARLSTAVWNAAHRAFMVEKETLVLKPGEADATIKLTHKELAWVEDQEDHDEPKEEDLEGEDSERRGTWQKVVTATPRSLPALLPDGSVRKTSRWPVLLPPGTTSRSRLWLGLIVVLALLLSGVF